MKSRTTHPLPQVVLTSVLAISIACTYKSVGSQPVANNNVAPQAETQSNAAPDQETVRCTLKLAGAPAIKGVRLGMTADEVLALYPGSKDDPQVQALVRRPPGQFGTSELLIIPSRYAPKDAPVEITQVNATLLDGRISTLNIGYNGPQFPHVDKFVEKLVAETGLPGLQEWDAYVGMDSQLKTLKCSDFEVRVFAGGKGGNLNYVLIKDLLAEKKLADRQAKAEAQATPTPKQ